MNQFVKFQHPKAHPMHIRVNKGEKSRLKRSSFSSSARYLRRSLDTPSLEPNKEMEVTKACPPWKRHEFPQIRTEIEGLVRKDAHYRSTLRGMTQDLLQNTYPVNDWIRVYTDGLAKDAIKDGGGGIYIEWPDGQTQETSIPTGLHSSNYKAEAEALQEAALTLLSRTDTYNSKVVLLSDAKSVLQSLKNTKGTEYNPLVRALISLNLSAQEVVLQ